MNKKPTNFNLIILILYILFTLFAWIVSIKLLTIHLIDYSKWVSSFTKGFCAVICCTYTVMVSRSIRLGYLGIIAGGLAIAAFDPPSFERLWLLLTSWLILVLIFQYFNKKIKKDNIKQ